jgi:hypothetical protein
MYDARYRVAMDFDFYARIIVGGTKGVYVPGALGHVKAGGKSSDIRVRSLDYYPITARYVGRIRGAWSVSGFVLRSMIYNMALKHRSLYVFANRWTKRFTIFPDH